MEMVPGVRKYCQVLLHLITHHLFGCVAVRASPPLTEIEIEILVVNKIVLQCVCMCACVPPSSSRT